MGLLSPRLLHFFSAFSANIDWVTEIMKWLDSGDSLSSKPIPVTAVFLAASLLLFWRAVAYATATPNWWMDPLEMSKRRALKAKREFMIEQRASPRRMENADGYAEMKAIEEQVDEEIRDKHPGYDAADADATTPPGQTAMLITLNPMGLECMAAPWALSMHARDKQWTYFMLGLPFIGPVTALFVSDKVLNDNPLIDHLESRIGILQLLIEDGPNAFIDLYYIVTASEDEGTFWYKVSLATSAFFLAKAIHACAVPMLKEEGSSSDSD